MLVVAFTNIKIIAIYLDEILTLIQWYYCLTKSKNQLYKINMRATCSWPFRPPFGLPRIHLNLQLMHYMNQSVTNVVRNGYPQTGQNGKGGANAYIRSIKIRIALIIFSPRSLMLWTSMPIRFLLFWCFLPHILMD